MVKNRDCEGIMRRCLDLVPQIHTNDVTQISVVFLPYVSRITDQIGRLLLTRTVKILPTPKDTLNPLLVKGIYNIPCSCG